MQTLRGMKKFADGEDAAERREERDQPRWRGGDLSLRLCGVSRRQRQLNKAISFPVVCRKQLSAAASAAATTRSPWSSIFSVLIGLRHTAARRHTRTHADGNRRINAHARNRNMGAHTHKHSEDPWPVSGYTPVYLCVANREDHLSFKHQPLGSDFCLLHILNLRFC